MTVRVLVWGGEHIHVSDHLDAIAAHPESVLLQIISCDAEPPQSIWSEVDAVIVDGPTDAHARQLDAIPATIPVFVEKPLGVSAAEAERVAATLSARPHAVGFFLHLTPAVADWITHSHDATQISVRFGHDGRARGRFDDTWRWMIDPAQGGTGSFADLGIHAMHLIDLVRPDIDWESATLTLVPAIDGLSDAGGTATLTADGCQAQIEVTAESSIGFSATSTTPTGRWEVDGGPDAAHAVTAFLDWVSGRSATATTISAADDALRAQRRVEWVLGIGE